MELVSTPLVEASAVVEFHFLVVEVKSWACEVSVVEASIVVEMPFLVVEEVVVVSNFPVVELEDVEVVVTIFWVVELDALVDGVTSSVVERITSSSVVDGITSSSVVDGITSSVVDGITSSVAKISVVLASASGV